MIIDRAEDFLNTHYFYKNFLINIDFISSSGDSLYESNSSPVNYDKIKNQHFYKVINKNDDIPTFTLFINSKEEKLVYSIAISNTTKFF